MLPLNCWSQRRLPNSLMSLSKFTHGYTIFCIRICFIPSDLIAFVFGPFFLLLLLFFHHFFSWFLCFLSRFYSNLFFIGWCFLHFDFIDSFAMGHRQLLWFICSIFRLSRLTARWNPSCLDFTSAVEYKLTLFELFFQHIYFYLILYCFWHVLCGVQIQWPIWSNMVQYAHIWTFYLLLFLFYFEIISYKHHSDNLKTQFSIFFLINCPLLIFSPARIPCVCLSIGNHIILSASHMCATLNLNQESKFLSVQVRGKIEADNVIDWKSTKQKPINTQSHIYV